MPEPQSGALTTSPQSPLYDENRNKNLAGAVGIEPTPKVLETSILPLNYAPIKMVEGDGFEPPNPKERIYSPPRLATSLPLQNGAGDRSRTHDLLITSQLLYQLSYTGILEIIWWVRTESNRRHLELQSNALPTELLTHIL